MQIRFVILRTNHRGYHFLHVDDRCPVSRYLFSIFSRIIPPFRLSACLSSSYYFFFFSAFSFVSVKLSVWAFHFDVVFFFFFFFRISKLDYSVWSGRVVSLQDFYVALSANVLIETVIEKGTYADRKATTIIFLRFCKHNFKMVKYRVAGAES